MSDQHLCHLTFSRIQNASRRSVMVSSNSTCICRLNVVKIIGLYKWWPLGRAMGCVSSPPSWACSSLPPTRKTLFLLKNRLRSSRWEWFANCLEGCKIRIYSWNASCCAWRPSVCCAPEISIAISGPSCFCAGPLELVINRCANFVTRTPYVRVPYLSNGIVGSSSWATTWCSWTDHLSSCTVRLYWNDWFLRADWWLRVPSRRGLPSLVSISASEVNPLVRISARLTFPRQWL